MTIIPPIKYFYFVCCSVSFWVNLFQGANLSYLDSKGCTPLLWAAAFGCQTTVKILLPGDDDGDNPSRPSDRFEPVHAASSVGATEVCQLLIDHHNEVHI